MIVTPLLQKIFPDISGFNSMSTGIVMGIMILPIVSSLSEDALKAVPQSLREASFGIGATRFQTATKVVVPAAYSGIVVSVILAISRAIGETMIVAIAAGQQPRGGACDAAVSTPRFARSAPGLLIPRASPTAMPVPLRRARVYLRGRVTAWQPPGCRVRVICLGWIRKPEERVSPALVSGASRGSGP